MRHSPFLLSVIFFFATAISSLNAARIATHMSRPKLTLVEKLSKSVHVEVDKVLKVVSAHSYTDSAVIPLEKKTYVATPFAYCGRWLQFLQELAEGHTQFRACGKLQKAGDFFVTEDRKVLAKVVSSSENELLMSWGKTDAIGTIYSGGSQAFESTLLIPVSLTITIERHKFHIAPNETERLQRMAGTGWVARASYDVKPLPNLSGGLAALIQAMLHDWGASLPPLKNWTNWQLVRQQLKRDLEYLNFFNLVDYSLFINVLVQSPNISKTKIRRKKKRPISLDIAREKGCIAEPNASVIACFSIIDYLTELTYFRGVESSFKAQKFALYSEKALNAFDCLGDLNAHACHKYRDYAKIWEAAEDSKQMEKAAFIGSKTFQKEYVCGVEIPHVIPDPKKWLVDRMLLDRAQNYTIDVRRMASPEGGTQVVGADFVPLMQIANKKNLEFYKGESFQWAVDAQLEHCTNAVWKFATGGYLSGIDKTANPNNILWNPVYETVMVVRGQPLLFYSHTDAAVRALEKKCFMPIVSYKCKPRKNDTELTLHGRRFHFDWKRRFGKLQIMVMLTRKLFETAFIDYMLVHS